MSKHRLPVIGMTCTQFVVGQGARPPRFGQNETYIQAVVRAGGVPFLIPELVDAELLRILYDRSDGLLLPGGDDVHPARYGEAIHEKCGLITSDRDEVELTLARWAVDEGKPLLAICRGIQVLNVALGGSLYQDIQAQVAGALKHAWYPDYPRNHRPHTVALPPGTHLAGMLVPESGGGPETACLAVNSLHHQAIRALAPRLTVAACAPDGIVEAVEVGDHPFALGVQWHPEELALEDAQAQRIFDALVEACLTALPGA